MDKTLLQKKQKILKRLENTIESTNCILYEINKELEGMIENRKSLEQTAEIYEKWISKGI